VAAAGLDHPEQFTLAHFSRRVSPHEVKNFAELYPSLQPGELLAGTGDRRFEIAWGWRAPMNSARCRARPERLFSVFFSIFFSMATGCEAR
jgi:hypothetical protein